MPTTSVNDSLAALSSRWPSVHGQTFVLQYVLSNPLPGDADHVYVTFTDGVAVPTLGTSPNPDATLSLSATDFLLMMNGLLDAQKAIAMRRLQVTGDVEAVRRIYVAATRPSAFSKAAKVRAMGKSVPAHFRERHIESLVIKRPK